MKPSKYNVPPIDISTINHSKVKTLSAYASKVLSDNKECFVAQWVMQNQDKNIDDYVLCYSYRGEAMKFWMEEKNERN